MIKINEIKEMSNRVIDLYSDLDSKIESLKKETNINCIKGCGKCCYNEQIEMTILEFIPLAILLYEKKMIEETLDKLENNPKICILYCYDSPNIHKGNCLMYQYRSLLCRLFGFSCLLNKYNNLVFTTCNIIKKNYNGIEKKIEKDISRGLKIPLITEYATMLKDISPYLSEKMYPVNTAIKYAIEKVMWIDYFDKR